MKSVASMTRTEAIKELFERGARCCKKEDRHGETKSGWWMDDTWLAPPSDPKQALRELNGDG